MPLITQCPTWTLSAERRLLKLPLDSCFLTQTQETNRRSREGFQNAEQKRIRTLLVGGAIAEGSVEP